MNELIFRLLESPRIVIGHSVSILAIFFSTSTFAASSSDAGPPPGTSYFEQLFDFDRGLVPTTFESLVEYIQLELFKKEAGSAANNTSANAQILEIPDGRSPERGVSGYHSPRRIVSFDGVNSTFSTPKIFLGYVPEIHQLQVISWSQEGRANAFLVVNNFGPGLVPQLVRPERSSCTVCHQNQGAHFSRFPWSETTTVNTDLRAKLDKAIAQGLVDSIRQAVKAKGLDDTILRASPPNSTFEASNKLEEAIKTAYPEKISSSEVTSIVDQALIAAGLPPASGRLSLGNAFNFSGMTSNGSAFTFDATVRRAAKALQSARVCESLCGGNRDCRRYLLGLGLMGNHPILSGSSATANRILTDYDRKLARIVTPIWPKDRFSYHSSVLPDRDPLISPESGGTTIFLKVTDPDQFLFSQQGSSLGFAQDLPPFNQPGAIAHALGRRNAAGVALIRTQLNAGIQPAYLEGISTVSDVLTNQGIKDVRATGHEGIASITTLRPKVGAIDPAYAATALSPSLFSCLGLTEADITELNKVSFARLEDIIFNSKSMDPLLQSWPPTRTQTMKAFREAVTNDFERDRKELECKGELPQVLNEKQAKLVAEAIRLASAPLAGTPVNRESAAKSFRRYCASCHAGSNAIKALPLSNLTALGTYRDRSGLGVIEKMSSGAMPPRALPQPSEAERREMMQAIRAP